MNEDDVAAWVEDKNQALFVVAGAPQRSVPSLMGFPVLQRLSS